MLQRSATNSDDDCQIGNAGNRRQLQNVIHSDDCAADPKATFRGVNCVAEHIACGIDASTVASGTTRWCFNSGATGYLIEPEQTNNMYTHLAMCTDIYSKRDRVRGGG